MARILKRPMFNRGGSTNNGIMTGLVDRKGYDNGTLVTRAKELAPGFEEVFREFSPKTKLPLGQVGLNLISGQYAGDGLLKNLAGSVRDPYAQFVKADDAREAAIRGGAGKLAVQQAISEVNKLSKDERLEVEKLAKLAFEAGEFNSYDAALSEFLKAKIYSKAGNYSPEVMARMKINERDQAIEGRTKDYTGGNFPDSYAIAKSKATFDIDRTNIISKNPDLDFDPIDPFIDVTGKRSSYNEGSIYFNPALDTYHRYEGIVDKKPKFVDITDTIER